MATKRIIDQPLDTALSPGDLIIVDSEEQGVGTRKFDLGTELTGIKQDLEELIDGGAGMSEDFKLALHNILEKVAYIDEDGQDYLDALDEAMWPPTNLVSISAVFTQGDNVIYDTDNLDTLKQYLVVTAHYSDSSTSTVTSYTLSGTLEAGTSTITVSYMQKTTTFNVTVTHQIVGWYYPFDQSLLSEGTREFNFTGVENYDDGLFNRKCYYHAVDDSGGSVVDNQMGLKAINLSASEYPNFGSDFTISCWCKRDYTGSTTSTSLHPIWSTIWVNNNYPGLDYFSSVTPESSVAVDISEKSGNKLCGVALQCYNGEFILRITNSTFSRSSQLQVAFPENCDVHDWHHYAITRKGNTVRMFIDGILLASAQAADNTVYPVNQIAIGAWFEQVSGTKTNLAASTWGEWVQDVYIAESCKWETSFDPLNIVY